MTRTIAILATLAVLALGFAVPSGAESVGRRKPKRCPAALTHVTVPRFATAPADSGTTTTTVPCRAVELDRRASYLGVMSWGLKQQVPAGTQLSDALIDFALRDDGHGKVTGTLEGVQSQTLLLSTCPSTTTSPGVMKARLIGERDATTLSLAAEAVTYTPPQVTPCPGGQPGVIGGVFVFPQTAAALQGLTGAPARYRYHHKETVQAGAYPFTVEYEILVVRVKKR